MHDKNTKFTRPPNNLVLSLSHLTGAGFYFAGFRGKDRENRGKKRKRGEEKRTDGKYTYYLLTIYIFPTFTNFTVCIFYCFFTFVYYGRSLSEIKPD